jgi:hypothetical protein
MENGDMTEEFADFTGTCGRSSSATSIGGLHEGQRVKLNGNPDLSDCTKMNYGACISDIVLEARNPQTKMSKLTIDKHNPTDPKGEIYFGFTDETPITYWFLMYSKDIDASVINYDSDKPVIHKILWSDTRPPGDQHIQRASA